MATWTNPMIGNHDNAGQKYGDPRSGYIHRGYDIGTAGVTGRPVVAGSAGTVTVSAFSANKRGHHVLIDHGDGIRTLYQHLASRTVDVGQTVATGQQIGICGNTGGDYAIHLHLQVMTRGSGTSWNDDTDTTDPKPFFAARGVTLGADTPVYTPDDPGTPNPQEDQMLAFARLDGTNTVWVGDGVQRRGIATPVELADLIYKIQTGFFAGKTEVQVVTSLAWLGQPV